MGEGCARCRAPLPWLSPSPLSLSLYLPLSLSPLVATGARAGGGVSLSPLPPAGEASAERGHGAAAAAVPSRTTKARRGKACCLALDVVSGFLQRGRRPASQATRGHRRGTAPKAVASGWPEWRLGGHGLCCLPLVGASSSAAGGAMRRAVASGGPDWRPRGHGARPRCGRRPSGARAAAQAEGRHRVAPAREDQRLGTAARRADRRGCSFAAGSPPSRPGRQFGAARRRGATGGSAACGGPTGGAAAEAR